MIGIAAARKNQQILKNIIGEIETDCNKIKPKYIEFEWNMHVHSLKIYYIKGNDIIDKLYQPVNRELFLKLARKLS